MIGINFEDHPKRLSKKNCVFSSKALSITESINPNAAGKFSIAQPPRSSIKCREAGKKFDDSCVKRHSLSFVSESSKRTVAGFLFSRVRSPINRFEQQTGLVRWGRWVRLMIPIEIFGISLGLLQTTVVIRKWLERTVVELWPQCFQRDYCFKNLFVFNSFWLFYFQAGPSQRKYCGK